MRKNICGIEILRVFDFSLRLIIQGYFVLFVIVDWFKGISSKKFTLGLLFPILINSDAIDVLTNYKNKLFLRN